MMSATLFHFYGLLHSSAALILFNTYSVKHQPPMGHPPQWRFLTSFNLIVQFIFFSSSFYLDLVANFTKFKFEFLRMVNCVMYASIVFPLSLFVFTNFWVIFELNNELVEPTTIDNPMPMWCSHVFHTLILFVVLENHFSPIEYPSRMLGLVVNMYVSLCCSSYIMWIHYTTGAWGYRFMKTMRIYEKVLFIAAQAWFFAGLYLFGQLLNLLYGLKPLQVHTAPSGSSNVFAGFSESKKIS